MAWVKFVGFTAIVSMSGLAYIKYSQFTTINKKVQQLTASGELKKFLFESAEQSSYYNDERMTNFQKSFNVSHINRYKSTLFKFVQGKTLQTCAGTNRNLKYYPPGTDLTLIDWSPKMVSMGIAKTSPTINYKYIVGDVTKMPFNDNQFDTVVDIFGLESVLDPQLALKQIRRVCKQDGNIILMNQGLSDIVQFHYWQNASSGQKLYHSGVFQNRNWEKIIKQFDFQIVESERKKNGKLYIYLLKNKKDKNWSQKINETSTKA